MSLNDGCCVFVRAVEDFPGSFTVLMDQTVHLWTDKFISFSWIEEDRVEVARDGYGGRMQGIDKRSNWRNKKKKEAC